MANPTNTIRYSAFGRSFPSSGEAEAYGLRLLSTPSAWEGITPPTSFILFLRDEGEIYTDNCCHTNKRGGQIIAQTIAGAIAEDFATTPCYDAASATNSTASSRRCAQTHE